MHAKRSLPKEPPDRQGGFSGPDSELMRIVASTGEAAFVTDERERIVAWNDAAERLLGHRAPEVRGRPCHAVIRGVDVFGNRFCDQDCPLERMARSKEPIQPFAIRVRRTSGEELRATVCAVVLPRPGSSGHYLLHILRPVMRAREAEALLRGLLGREAVAAVLERAARTGSFHALSEREREVLALLAEGRDTGEIGEKLHISVSTVRSHVRNILRKLGAHSRLEAVALRREQD
jgi:PAS domain S-box-containing protein